MITAKEKYEEVFREEMEAHADALESYPGEIFPELVFRMVRELESSFIRAIEQHVIFDILAVGRQFARAAKFLVHEKDIVFCILSVLPPPSKFSEDAQFVLAQIVDQVEKAHGGAIERLQKKWRWELKYERDAA